MEERFRVRVREYSSSFLSVLFFFFFAVGLFLSCFFFFCCWLVSKLFFFFGFCFFVFFWSYSGPVNFVTDGVPCILDKENKPG